MKTADFLKLHKDKGSCSCVYFLSDKGIIVYIGSTEYPHQRIYAHTNGNKCFDDVMIMTCSKSEKLNMEGDLIRQHLPLYNKHIPKKTTTPKTQISTIQICKLTGEKLKAISDKRKENGKLLNKQTEILTDLINKLYTKECK